MNDKLVKSLKENPVKYARLLGFSLLTDLHNEWIKDMVWQQEDDETLLAHRGSYKTTCVSFALALIIVLKPNKTTIFIRKTDTDVVEIAKQTDKILHSDLFSYIVKEIYGVDLVVTSNSYQIDTNLNTGTKGTPQLICLGIHTSLTGKHSDYIFTDDIVNVQDRTSRAERNSTKIQYQELQPLKNTSRLSKTMDTLQVLHMLIVLCRLLSFTILQHTTAQKAQKERTLWEVDKQ